MFMVAQWEIDFFVNYLDYTKAKNPLKSVDTSFEDPNF